MALACNSLSALGMGEAKLGTFEISFFGGITNCSPKEQNQSFTITADNGIAYGLGFEYWLSRGLSIEIDFINTAKNYQTNENGTTTYKLSYVEVPILFKLSPSKSISLFWGPYMAGLVIDAKAQSSGTEAGVQSQFGQDYGLTAGLWIGYRADSGVSLGLEGRYNHGLADIENDNQATTKLLSRNILFLLRFRIPL